MTPEFDKILSWGGSPQGTCHCGRVHYTASGDFMDPGELDGLNAKHRAEPDQYIPDHENDSVGITSINGVTHIWNCPCGSLDRIEKFVWAHRRQFIDYYQARTQRELKEATENAAALAGVSNTKMWNAGANKIS